MFKISFSYRNQSYSAMVYKIDNQPTQFVVFGINPSIKTIPDKLIYKSSPSNDQLIYCSFEVDENNLLYLIGESIFYACDKQEIAVHE